MQTQTQTQTCLSRIQHLPNDIVKIIYQYISHATLVWVNKEKYDLYHTLFRNQIGNTNYESYIRDMIRKDHDFVFSFLLYENCYKWLQIKQYFYKSIIFANYIYFLQHFCLEHNSTKCRNVILDFLKESGLHKNIHKKNIVKHVKWRL